MHQIATKMHRHTPPESTKVRQIASKCIPCRTEGSLPLSSGIELWFSLRVNDRGAAKVEHEMLAWVDMGACTARGSKGVWIFVTKSELQTRFDPAAQYGKASSGLSTLAASTFGYVSIPGTNLQVSMVASRRIANAVRKRVRRGDPRRGR